MDFSIHTNKFIVPAKKLLLIKNFNIPDDVLDIIKDYLFYNKTYLKFYKIISNKKHRINVFIQNAWSRNKLKNITINQGWGEELAERYETQESWMFRYDNFETIMAEGLDVPVAFYDKFHFHGQNCSKCGEYHLISYSNNFNTSNNIKLCDCS
tara:strand:+ start:5024 stop:5482 length:459 start_codon:yes stop_codon:yes gene_type:complete